ncbi:MAG: Ig-like domain repeat protein, partial [Treponema sp.]|nr:Ig-like domain repeat protein [Treponema sp.]
ISSGNLNYAVSKEGTTNLVFSVKDNAGNEATKSAAVKIDKTMPSISLSGNLGEGVWSRDTSRTLTVTASDSLSGMAALETKLNDGAWVKEANAASASFTYTGEGIFRREIRATDAAGNVRTSASVISLDRRGPVISGFSFPSGWTRPDYLFSGVKVVDSTVAASSVSGVDPASFTVTPAGKSSISVTSSYNASTGALAAFTLPGLPEGSYSLTFSAKDKIGNVSTPVIQTVKVDGTAPQISAAAGNVLWKGNSWNIPVTVNVVKEEHGGINPAGWKYKIDGGNTAAMVLSLSNGKYSGDIVVPVLTGGNHSLTVIGVDNAGNESSCQTNFKIDDVPPAIGYDALFAAVPENAPWTNVPVFTVSAEDAGSDIREFTAAIKRGLLNGQWAETGDAVFNGTTVTFPEGIPDGIFQFKFRAVDNAANVKEETLYARLDRTGPAISVPSGLSGVSSVAASAEDASSGIDGGSWEWRDVSGGAAGPWQAGNTAVLPEGKDRMVSFRLKDKAGNRSEKSGEITIDLTPPEISAEVPEYAYRESLDIGISAHDGITAVKKAWYSLDGGSPREISGWPSVQALIPVEDYREGVHLLRLFTEDSVAHRGQSEEYTFIIDRTAPEIEAVDIHSKLEPELLLGDLDFSGSAEVFVNIRGSDWYADGETTRAGKIIAWYRYVSQDKDSTPVFPDSGKETDPEFNITGLKEGPNYIYFRAEDAGGNFSAVFRRIVSVDPAIPASPIIRSTTHPEAGIAEQAFPFSTAEFVFRPPVNVTSGIKRYQWRLEKVFIYGGAAGNGEIIEQGSSEKLNASLEGKLSLSLEDNQEYEFYRLFVSCTASNGNVSGESVYQFRIDTASPNEVRVITVPQIDREEWYRDTFSLVMWNQPADMTGIAEYRYFVSAGEGWIPPDDSSLKEYDLSGWHKTTDTEFQADLRPYLNGKGSGVIQIAVCAVDYAGNRRLGMTSVKCDFVPPAFGNTGGESIRIMDTAAEIGKAKHIAWDEIADGESGLDHISLLVLDGDSEGADLIRAVMLPPDVRKFTLDRLENNGIYTLQFTVSDRAGNKLILHRLFATGNRELPPRFEVPYEETINGFELSGRRITGGGNDEFEDIYLAIPGAMQIHEIKTINGEEIRNRLDTIRLEEITVTENMFSSGKSKNGRYEASADGFRIEGGRIGFNRETGAVLLESRYIRPFILDGVRQSAAIAVGQTGLGFPPVARFSSGAGALGGQAVIETFSAAPGGGEIPGFPLVKAESLRLDMGKEWFYGGAISFDSSMLERHGISFTTSNGRREIQTGESRADAESRNILANIKINPAEPVVLNIRGTTFTVKAAGIRGYFIDIYEAVLELPDSYEIRKLTLRNFIIDAQNGTVTNGPDFISDPINTTAPNGGRFESAGVKFGSDGKLLISGVITSAIYGDMQVHNLVLTNEGLDWDEGGAISGFTALVHGFPIVAVAARFVREGIFIERGEILHGDKRRQFINLGLTHRKSDDVFNDGTITDHYYLENNYGNPVLVKGGRITNAGVFGAVIVPLGDIAAEVTGRESWEFPAVKFDPLGGMHGFYPGSDNIVIGGFEFTPEDIEFFGSHIRIGTLRSCSIAGMNPAILEFNDFCFTQTAVLTGLPPSEPAEYSIHGWKIAYSALALTAEGLKGAGALQLPEALGGFTVKFPESLVLGSGGIVSGKAEKYAHSAAIRGIPVELPDAELELRGEEFVLACAAPLIRLALEDSVEMRFGKTCFDSSGLAVSGEEGKERIGFTSSNGYRVDSASYAITQNGICLSGSLGTQWWDEDSKVVIPGKGIELLSGFAVVSGESNTEFSYRYGDWTVQGRGAAFGLDTLQVAANTVKYRGIEIQLGPLNYTTEGLLVREGDCVQDLELVSFAGASVKLVESRFGLTRLTGSVFITMPSPFNEHTLYYESINLGADGSFGIENEIEKYQFSLGGFEFSFEGITANTTGIYIRGAGVTLPPSMESAQLRLSGLRLSEGSLNLDSSFINPVKIWGMIFSLNDFNIKDRTVTLSGTVSLPETMPGTLAGRRLFIRDFTAGLEGGIKSLDIRMDEECTIPFLDAWALSLSNLTIRYTDGQPWILLNNASLRFPTGFVVNDAVIEQVRFNPIQGKFDFDSIKANTNIRLGFAGIDFYLTQLWLDAETAFGFKGSIAFPVEGMPGFLAGRTAELNSFSIKKDGSLGTVSASLTGLNGEILPGAKGVMLQDGSLVVKAKNSRDIELSVAGDILMTGYMPGSLAGSRLSIEAFTINPAIPAITQLKAEAFFPSVGIYNIAFSDIRIDFRWDGVKQDGTIGLSGNVIFPASFPEYLAGISTEIQDFRIGLDGSISVFDVSYETEPGVAFDVIGAVQMKDAFVSLYKDEEKFGIDLAGTILFPADKFPKGLGGLKTKTIISLDSIKGIKTLYAKIDVPDQKLFDSLAMYGVKLIIDKQEDHPAEISLRGSLGLPDFFPQGLKGLVIDIRRFTISTDGKISDIDISTSGINTKIFNAVDLKSGAIKFQKGDEDEFILDVSGRVKLVAAGLPAALREPELVIGKLSLSTRTGLRTFDIGLATNISFDFLGGFRINVTSLQLGDSGISLSAGITLPSYFPAGIANNRIDLTVFKLGWDGRVADIQGGMGKLELQIAGFGAKIDSLYFEKDPAKQFYVSLRSCRIRFPSYLGSLGGKEFALKNARFSPDGSFEGDFEAPKFDLDIAGFGMELIGPTLEFAKRQISFSQVKLRTPDFIGGVKIALPGVRISESRGIEIDGGEFKLPEFPVGGLLFSNVFVKFTFSGSDYIIGGGGNVLIPGAGNIGATLIFASRSSLYPIGLKQAEFSWAAAMGGIPLGNTGLALSGISGGIAYGPPDEVPQKVRNMFDSKGPRIKLGLYINDLYGGNVISMRPNVWVDISNANWAFKGDASILSGFINADITAAMNGNGFYGGLYAELRFARGGVDIYIFDKNKKVIFSGSGYVEFGIPRGFIVNKKILFVRVVVPSSDWFFGSFNADFGRFTNGKDGFKASVNIPVIGGVGIFVGNGIFEVGNVSSFTIEKPSWAAPSLRSSIRRSVSNPGIISNDVSDYGGITGTDYTVNVYGKDLERVVFLLAYAEGDPAVTITSPSGKDYSEKEGNIETVLYENLIAFIIHDPEQGTWQLRVENAEEETYSISVLGTGRMPSLVITEPDFRTELVQDEFVLRGQAEKGYNSIIVKAREDRDKPGLELGVFPVESDGSFEALVPVQDIADGEYVISAELVTGDEFTATTAYAPGKIRVDRSGLPLLEPEPVRIAETDRGTIVLRWENNNGARTAGYNVRIVNKTTGSENIVYVGNITSFTLPGFDEGEEISFQVAAIDSDRQESAYSTPIDITTGTERPVINRPLIRDELFSAEAVSGGIVEGSITVSIEEYEESYEASGYILARQRKTETNAPGALYFTGPVKIEQKTVNIPWHLSLPVDTVPGVYAYPCEAVNEANGELSDSFVLEVRVQWPEPEIHEVNPVKINGMEEQLITLYGSG